MSTYTPIASVTLSSAQSSVTFSGIPQTYTDLVLVMSAFGSVSGADIRVQVNSDTTSNYSLTRLVGYTTAFSNRASNATYWQITNSVGIGSSSSEPTADVIHFMNYSNTTTNKTMLVRHNQPQSSLMETAAQVGLWRSTSAITSITFSLSSGNYSSGSTFNLYGVANASITNVAKATGGDSVYTDGTYWYHIFRSSGTFTPTQALTADYLVVAGGGGGGWRATIRGGGGGGAGGLRSTVTATGGGGSLESALSLAANTGYTVTVGAGGAASSGTAAGSDGSNSVFSSITSTGGGGGGYDGGRTGGSGGGGSSGGSAAGAAGTANQGYAGGNGGSWSTSPESYFNGGGGGGAGAVGAAGSTTSANGGNGGNGVAVAISGSSVTYAGGGGGGSANGAAAAGNSSTGGTGGGGAGGGAAGVAGTANLGGGGGGGSNADGTSKAGGSGIVIVRYAA